MPRVPYAAADPTLPPPGPLSRYAAPAARATLFVVHEVVVGHTEGSLHRDRSDIPTSRPLK